MRSLRDPVAPPVLGAERAGQEAGLELQQAYVPCQSVSFESDEALLELRTTDEGYTALVAFSSLEAMAEGCGVNQAWCSVRVDELDQLRAEAGAEMTLWDVVLPEDQRKD